MPDNPFRQPVSNPFRTAPKEEGPSANYVAREMASRGALDSMLAVPNASGIILANSMNAIRALGGQAARIGINNVRSLVGMERAPNPGFGERYADASSSESMAQRVLRGIPRPTVEGVASAVNSIPSLMPGGETPPEAMERNRQAFRDEELAMRQEHPRAAWLGDVGGDVLAIAMGRRTSGSGRMMQRFETKMAGKVGAEATTSLADDLGKIFKGPTMQRLARGAGRSIETGVEAAVLDVLKDPNADPMETAALAAGGQLVGSGMLAGAQGLVGKNWATKITMTAMTTWGLLQVLKSATPGGEDRILESMESGYDKVALMLGLGLSSAAIGATRYGRGNTNLSEQTRNMLDGISTAHRGTLLSVLTDWTKGDESERSSIESTLNSIASNPAYKGKTPEEQALVRRLAGQVKYQTGGQF
jgi:hypothetical protein